MNKLTKLCGVILVCILPMAARAVDLATIDRSIKNEPGYQTKSPGYCLLVFGKAARTRIWIVVDGQRLYVDRNGNGDLTEPDELVRSSTSADYAYQSFQLGQIREVGGATLHDDLRLWVYDDAQFVCSIALARGSRQHVGSGGQRVRPRLAARPQDAPVIHLNGPMTLARHGGIEFYPRGGENIDDPESRLRVMIGSPGLGEGTFAAYHMQVLRVGDGYRKVTAEIEFPNSDANAGPFTLREQFQVLHGGAYMTLKKVSVPENAGAGFAKWTLSIPDWKEEHVTPGTFKMMLIGGRNDLPKIVPFLHDRDDAVRAAAIHAIATIDRAAIPSLVEELETDPENRGVVAELSLAALREMGAMLRSHSDKLTQVAIISQPDLSNDDLKLLHYLPGAAPADNLTHFNVSGALGVTDDGLKHIEHLTKLTSLVLSQTKITDDGLRHLNKLTELTFINLRGTGLTDQGLTHIGHLPKLSFVVLEGNAITDDGLKVIANPKTFVSLTSIGLTDTQITDEGLVHLKNLKNLQRLYMGRTRITSKGVAQLTDMPQLESLSFSASSVDDAMTALLAEMKTLRKLELHGPFTDKLKAELRQKLPKCEIKYWR